MPTPNAIPLEQLVRIIGTLKAPVLLDVRSEEEWAADLRLISWSIRCDNRKLADLAAQLSGRRSAAACESGRRRSQGAAAWLRAKGCPSEYLDGGFEAWRAADLPLIDGAKLPARDPQGRTVWVTQLHSSAFCRCGGQRSGAGSGRSGFQHFRCACDAVSQIGESRWASSGKFWPILEGPRRPKVDRVFRPGRRHLGLSSLVRRARAVEAVERLQHSGSFPAPDRVVDRLRLPPPLHQSGLFQPLELL